MERVLITGADGFVASHLIAELCGAGCSEVHGIGLKEKPLAEADPRFIYRVADLNDIDLLRSVLDSAKPDAVFHLAAQPSVAHSWKDPWTTYRVNILCQLNLMEAARQAGIEASFHIACSSEEYGKVAPDEVPIRADSRLKPCSHYAVSKVSQEMLGLMYFEAYGWRVFATRGFNQAGPGQSPDFAIPSFARQIALIESGALEPVLKVGNLEAQRDFTDVRDTVRAYRLLMERGSAGVSYNVCTGVARKMSDVLDELLALSRENIRVEIDPERQRPSDVPIVTGDSSRLEEETGWRPEIPFSKTLADTLDYFRSSVAGETGAGP